MDTLISPSVDVDYTVRKGEGPTSYKFYVDQNTLVYPKSFYAADAFASIRPAYEKNIRSLFS